MATTVSHFKTQFIKGYADRMGGASGNPISMKNQDIRKYYMECYS